MDKQAVARERLRDAQLTFQDALSDLPLSEVRHYLHDTMCQVEGIAFLGQSSVSDDDPFLPEASNV